MGESDFPYINCYLFSSAPANAVVCPTLAVDLIDFLYAPDLVYKLSLLKYKASPEAVAAKIEVKQCVNKFSLENKLLISEILVMSFFLLHRGFCLAAHARGRVSGLLRRGQLSLLTSNPCPQAGC